MMTLLFACATMKRLRSDSILVRIQRGKNGQQALELTVFCAEVKPPVALKPLKNLRNEGV